MLYRILCHFLIEKSLTDDSNLAVTFPSSREAEIAYSVLSVDPEPKRSQVKKELNLNNEVLSVTMKSREARQLRTGLNSLLENLALCTDTIARFGPPSST